MKEAILRTHPAGSSLRCLVRGRLSSSPLQRLPPALHPGSSPGGFPLDLSVQVTVPRVAASSLRVRLRSLCWAPPGLGVTTSDHPASGPVREPWGVSRLANLSEAFHPEATGAVTRKWGVKGGEARTGGGPYTCCVSHQGRPAGQRSSLKLWQRGRVGRRRLIACWGKGIVSRHLLAGKAVFLPNSPARPEIVSRGMS